jgi:hypothetical protein
MTTIQPANNMTEESKSDLSFSTNIPNSFPAQTTNPFSLTTAMATENDLESTALLVDVERNDCDSFSDQQFEAELPLPRADDATAPVLAQPYRHMTSSGSEPRIGKGKRFARVIKGLTWFIAILTLATLVLLLTDKIILHVMSLIKEFDRSSIDESINHIALAVCHKFPCRFQYGGNSS